MLLTFAQQQKQKRKHRLIIALVVAVILVLGISIKTLYDRFAYTTDSLIGFFPENTAVYLHGTFHGGVYDSLQRFVVLHPAFIAHSQSMLPAQLGEVFEHYSDDMREISIAFIYDNGQYIPRIAYLMTSNESARSFAAIWDDALWDVEIQETYVIVTSQGRDIALDHTLAEVFKQEYLPISNDWYVYLQRPYGENWLYNAFDRQYIQDYIDQFPEGHRHVLVSTAFRDNTLVLKTSLGESVGSDYEEESSLIDSVAADRLFAAKNIHYTSDAAVYAQKAIAGLITPDTSLKPGIMRRLLLEEDLLQTLEASGAIDAAYTKGEDPFVMIEIESSAPSDTVGYVLQTLASYDYPALSETRLRDGTVIQEYIAKVHDSLELNFEQKSGFELISVTYQGEIWPYFALKNDTRIVFTNNPDAVINMPFISEKIDFCRYGNAYVYSSFGPESAEKYGLDFVSVTRDNQTMYTCLR